jgi:hypothetical protein
VEANLAAQFDANDSAEYPGLLWPGHVGRHHWYSTLCLIYLRKRSCI